MSSLEELELRIIQLDERLRPIAQRPIDVTRPGWVERLGAGVPALDEAGVRNESEGLLAELSAAYVLGTEEARAAIRRFFAEYRSFGWAAALSTPGTNAEGLRQHLILFSMQDQGQDSRDALLALQKICREAAAAGVDTGPALREIAANSNGVNKYGMGSTRDMLLRHLPA